MRKTCQVCKKYKPLESFDLLPDRFFKWHDNCKRCEIKQELVSSLGDKYIDEDRGLTEKELNEGCENIHTIELLVDEYVNNTQNWVLTLYDECDNVIEVLELFGLTEKEVVNESEYYIRTCKIEVKDWTVVGLKK